MMIFYGFRPPLLRAGPRSGDAPLAGPAEPLRVTPADGIEVRAATAAAPAVVRAVPEAPAVARAVAEASFGPADSPPAAAGPPSPRRSRPLRRLAA
ncbi:hypothetical protein [Sphaerisporangium sp. NPDC051011]|uniref:hypothetical protein n=1 Tax=Sphaerisporangium sp. NPDC051011 TaxID=3155792 RepID=UPI0033C4AAFF